MRRFRELGVECELVAVDVNIATLDVNPATRTVQLGPGCPSGPGADPSRGRAAAFEARAEIEAALRGAEVVFIAAGLGGGTGTGAAPVVAEIARATGALVVAVVTLPFSFEGSRRRALAQRGLKELGEAADATCYIANDRLLSSIQNGEGGNSAVMPGAFRRADDAIVAMVHETLHGRGDKALIVDLVEGDVDELCTLARSVIGIWGRGP